MAFSASEMKSDDTEMKELENRILSFLLKNVFKDFQRYLCTDVITSSRDSIQKGLDGLYSALSQAENGTPLREKLLKAVRKEIHTNPQYKYFLDFALEFNFDVPVPLDTKMSRSFIEAQKQNLAKSRDLNPLLHELITYKMFDDIMKKRNVAKKPSLFVSKPLSDSKEIKDEAHLNTTQKYLIEGWFENDFPDLKDANESIIASLKRALNNEKLSDGDEAILTAVDMIGEINGIREVLFHPCPQNRRSGEPSAISSDYLYAGQEPPDDGVIYGKVFYWVKGDLNTPESVRGCERQGLLGLTAKNDDTALPVTQGAVQNYVRQLAANRIKQREQQLEAECVGHNRMVVT